MSEQQHETKGTGMDELVTYLRGLRAIRCTNWAEGRELCGDDCSVVVAKDGDWIKEVGEAGWFVVVNGRDGHRHERPFCGIACYLAYCLRAGYLDPRVAMRVIGGDGDGIRIERDEDAAPASIARFLIGFDEETMEVDVQLKGVSLKMPFEVYRAFVTALAHTGREIDRTLRRRGRDDERKH